MVHGGGKNGDRNSVGGSPFGDIVTQIEKHRLVVVSRTPSGRSHDALACSGKDARKLDPMTESMPTIRTLPGSIVGKSLWQEGGQANFERHFDFRAVSREW